MALAHPIPGHKLGDGFGYRPPIKGVTTTSFHGGRDVPAASGTWVLAPGNGRVVTVQDGWYRDSFGIQRVRRIVGVPIHDATAGNYIGIEFDGGAVVTFAHASAIARGLGPVAEGDGIMRVGSTGASTGPHVHMTAFASLNDARAWRRINPDGLFDYSRRPGQKGTSPATNPPVTPAPTEEQTLASAADGINSYITNHTQEALNSAVEQILGAVETRFGQLEGRIRTEVRGMIYFDAGEDGKLPFEQSRHVVVMNEAGKFQVLNPHPSERRGQLASIYDGPDDYKYVDRSRGLGGNLQPMHTGRFKNKVRETLVNRGEDRRDGQPIVTNEDAWEYLLEREARFPTPAA